MTAWHAVLVLLGREYFVIAAWLALDPFSFIPFCSLLFYHNFTTSCNLGEK